MVTVVAVKISDELKQRMNRLKDRVSWPDELRRFIEEKIRQEEAKDNLHKVVELVRSTEAVPKGFTTLSVREDRGSS